MIIGVPKEIKPSENRVALTPAGCEELVKNGHTVFIENNAGLGSTFENAAYEAVGAQILDTAQEVFAKAEMIMKVKEPIEQEYDLVREGQLLFTYFHFSSSEALTHAMIKQKGVCLAYETVQLPDNSLPLLIPMSEVAGRMATQEGAKYLEKTYGGKGLLLGGVPGVRPARVLVLGAGAVGTHAARMACGLGANVTIMDTNLTRLRYLSDTMPPNLISRASNQYNIRDEAATADLIIGSILKPGAKAPHLITREMLKEMQPGTVLVDVAIDQGGCFETSRPTTHQDPIYIIDDIIHYCVANMPGAVPLTSTLALTNATMPFALQLANKGWKQACIENEALKKGLGVVNGKVVYEPTANDWNLAHTPVEEVLN